MEELDLAGATVVGARPGDQVVLVLRNNRISHEQADRLKQILTERLPLVDWTIVAGVDEVIHIAAEQPAPR